MLLVMDTTPGYIDTNPLPAASVKWKYRSIYCIGESPPVGQWSDTVEITVGG